MRAVTIVSGCILALVFRAESQGQAPAKPNPALKAFQGMWRITYFEEIGKETRLTDSEKTRTITIEGNRFASWEKGKLLLAGTIKVVDSKSDPLKVNVVYDNPPMKQPEGFYIWRLKGNTLHTGGAYTGTTKRPTDFPTAQGSASTYQRWKRLVD